MLGPEIPGRGSTELSRGKTVRSWPRTLVDGVEKMKWETVWCVQLCILSPGTKPDISVHGMLAGRITAWLIRRWKVVTETKSKSMIQVWGSYVGQMKDRRQGGADEVCPGCSELQESIEHGYSEACQAVKCAALDNSQNLGWKYRLPFPICSVNIYWLLFQPRYCAICWEEGVDRKETTPVLDEITGGCRWEPYTFRWSVKVWEWWGTFYWLLRKRHHWNQLRRPDQRGKK